MPIIRLSIDIGAPPSRCFDLARSVDAHVASTAGTNERAIEGVTTGLLGLGDEVTWRARHFGITQTLTSRITAFDRPKRFQDSMVRGVFARIVHDHEFAATPAGTQVIDVFDYAAPLGLLGRLAERLFLNAYMTKLLRQRAEVLKRLAESDEWRRFVEP